MGGSLRPVRVSFLAWLLFTVFWSVSCGGSDASLRTAAPPAGPTNALPVTLRVTVEEVSARGSSITQVVAEVVDPQTPDAGTLSGFRALATGAAAVSETSSQADIHLSIVQGRWTVHVFGRDDSGATIARSQIAVEILSGQVSVYQISLGAEPPAPGAARLLFLSEPTGTLSLLPAVQVEVVDAAGNRDSTASNSITLSLASNPAGGNLGGTVTADALNGVATFADLTLDRAGSGYQLLATSSGLSQAISSSFGMTRFGPGFPLPTPASDPRIITTGPDGNLWFCEFASSRIGRITPKGELTEFPTPTANSGPVFITVGPDGALWFSEQLAGQIGRVTTSGVMQEFVIPTPGSRPAGVTTGPDGNLWFVENAGNQVGRLTPAGVFTEFPLPNANSRPVDITAGPDGNLWFTQGADSRRIGRITTGGVLTEFPVPASNQSLTGITSGPDGNLWFGDGNGNHIGQITTAGVVTEFDLPTPGSIPNLIVTGPDGNLWFTEAGSGQIGRITPGGVITEFSIGIPNCLPSGITVGPDGNLWFCLSNLGGAPGNEVNFIRP